MINQTGIISSGYLPEILILTDKQNYFRSRFKTKLIYEINKNIEKILYICVSSSILSKILLTLFDLCEMRSAAWCWFFWAYWCFFQKDFGVRSNDISFWESIRYEGIFVD
jgi:hypothetical protein